jgi:DNA-binding NtrC family response regulator
MRILVAEDEHLLAMSLREDLLEAGHEVVIVGDGQSAWNRILNHPPHLVLSDVRMPGMDGLSLMAKTKAVHPDLLFILMTTFASVKEAVQALQAGATDYLVKPFEREELLERIRRAEAWLDLKEEKALLEREVERLTRGGILLGAAPAMQQLWATVDRIAPVDVDVLIEGETGTGKEVVAQAIHASSHRASGPFVAVSCSILTGSLLENELFGHEKGAFTGADRVTLGRFEAAEGGTLFLDDVDDIPLETQAKLLRVLQERKVERLGSTQSRAVDFRLLSATKRDLAKMVEEGCFRQDLYYRLRVLHLRVPPLRERKEDISSLASFFVRKHGFRTHAVLPVLHEDTLRALRIHGWPGNVRELEHAVQAALALCGGSEILSSHLPREVHLNPPAQGPACPAMPEGPVRLDEVLGETERRLLRWALDRAGGNQSEASALLGIPRSTFQYRWRRAVPGASGPDRG